MANTIALKTSIYNQIDSLGDVFEDGQVPDLQTPPYITYNLANSFTSERDTRESLNYILTINAYDQNLSGDTTTVENLADSIEEALLTQSIIETNFYYQTQRETRQEIPTDEQYFFRREIVFTLKYNEKGV